MDNQQERTVGLEFIAGLVVGEGSFVLGVNRLKHGRMRIKPAFYMQMNDGETIRQVARSLQAHGLPAYVHHREDRGCWTVQINGFKRVQRFANALLPYMTGTKRAAATTTLSFIESRQGVPKGSPYSERDLDYVKTLRQINGNHNGKKTPL